MAFYGSLTRIGSMKRQHLPNCLCPLGRFTQGDGVVPSGVCLSSRAVCARRRGLNQTGSGASGLTRSITIWLCTRLTAGWGSRTCCTSMLSAERSAQ